MKYKISNQIFVYMIIAIHIKGYHIEFPIFYTNMGTGCSSGSSRSRDRSPSEPTERLRTHRLGNFTFQVYGKLY